jgi:hypothetical protein
MDILKWRPSPFCAVRSEAFFVFPTEGRDAPHNGGNWQVSSLSQAPQNLILIPRRSIRCTTARGARSMARSVLEYHHSGKVDHSTCSLVCEQHRRVSLEEKAEEPSPSIIECGLGNSDIAVGEKNATPRCPSARPCHPNPSVYAHCTAAPSVMTYARPPVSGTRNKDYRICLK